MNNKRQTHRRQTSVDAPGGLRGRRAKAGGSYGSRSRTGGSPFPPPGCPAPQARRRSARGRRSYCRGRGGQRRRTIRSTWTKRRTETHAYASKSPLLMASISCSVILIISCLRAAEDKQGENRSQEPGGSRAVSVKTTQVHEQLGSQHTHTHT